MHLHPTGSLVWGELPPCVVFHEATLTNRNYMRHVVGVRPRWVKPLLPTNYKFDVLRLTGRSTKGMCRHWCVQRRRVRELTDLVHCDGGATDEAAKTGVDAKADVARGAGAGAGAGAPAKVLTKQEKLAAARAKFLARKAARGK